MKPPTYAEIRAGMPRGDGEVALLAHLLRKTITPQPQGLWLNIDPDYQRGHIWSEGQSAAFVGHKLEGGDSPTLTIQRRPGDPVDELVDGKQRLLSILHFVEGHIPALLSDGHSYFLREWSPEDQRAIPHSLDLILRARVVCLPTRADVLRFYLRLNRGGPSIPTRRSRGFARCWSRRKPVSEGSSVSSPSVSEARVVDDVVLFTGLLDGGYYLRCSCGYIYRATKATEACPACGYGQNHAKPTDEAAYRADRKEPSDV